MNPLYRHIANCNAPVSETFLPWVLNGLTVGWVRPAFAEQLRAFPAVFRLQGGLLSTELEGDFQQLSRQLAVVAKELSRLQVIPRLLGEPYPVTAQGRDDALCTMDRVAAAYFGLRAFGQHLNGMVRKADGLYMWIARRAQDRLIFPGALDNMVAGGLPWGVSMRDNLRKECTEEANVPAALANSAVAIGAVSYNRVAERGFRPDVLYCYDLLLPESFEPQNTDGEVEEFKLLPIADVLALVRETDEFKLNCNLVLIDFFIRHGVIGPDEPDYLQIGRELRRPPGLPVG